MTMEELRLALLARAPAENEAKERWTAAVERIAAAASPPKSFDEVSSALPPKARYLGPGPWLDALKDAYRG